MPKEISIIIPVYNEEETIEELIRRIFTILRNPEVIIVDDHSTDETPKIVKRLQKEYNTLRFLKKTGDRGKTTSLLQGFNAAKGKILVMIDADLQYPPESIPKMVKLLKENRADIIIGKRIFKDTNILRRFLSFGFSLIFGRLFLGIPVTDIQTGEKAFKKEILKSIKIKAKKWDFDIEFLYKANKKGWRIMEIPIPFSERKAGDTKINIIDTTFNLAKTSFILFLSKISSSY